MYPIIICGDCGQKTLTHTIIQACSAYGGALVADGDKLYATEKNIRYSIFCMTALTDLWLSDAIIVLGKALLQISDELRLKDHYCILDAEIPAAVRFAAKTEATAVGCSLGSHDTFGISGYSDENTLLVSLKRNLICRDGTILEPQDFRVTTGKDCPAYPIMAAAAVLLLSGISPENDLSF